MPVAGSGHLRRPAGTVRVSTSTLAGVLCPQAASGREVPKGRRPRPTKNVRDTHAIARLRPTHFSWLWFEGPRALSYRQALTKALSQTPSAPFLPAGGGPLVGPSLSRRGGPRSIHSRHRRSAGLTSPPCDGTQEGWHGWKVGRG